MKCNNCKRNAPFVKETQGASQRSMHKKAHKTGGRSNFHFFEIPNSTPSVRRKMIIQRNLLKKKSQKFSEYSLLFKITAVLCL